MSETIEITDVMASKTISVTDTQLISSVTADSTDITADSTTITSDRL